MQRIVILLFVVRLISMVAFGAQCNRPVSDSAHLKVDPVAEKSLLKIGIDRSAIFEAVRETSIPESHGCWSSASGNFDGQILSVGVAQWNYGQGSLQPLLLKYRKSYQHDRAFWDELKKLMPNYGEKVFSNGCLRVKLTDECKKFLVSVQSEKGVLLPDFKNEIDELFNSDTMTQIQLDTFVKLLGRVSSDLARIFPNRKPTSMQIKWAIDTKVQQGGFPSDGDLERIRRKIGSMEKKEKSNALLSVLKWYEGLCESIDQDGVKLDCDFNKKAWSKIASSGSYAEDAFELVMFSHLKSRTASGKSGLYQADTFQRRAKIIFRVGSVHGNRSG